MGTGIDEAVADELLGIVAEAQTARGHDSLARYSDGSIRYISRGGSVSFYKPGDGRLDDAIAATGYVAWAVYMNAPLVKEGARPASHRPGAEGARTNRFVR